MLHPHLRILSIFWLFPFITTSNAQDAKALTTEYSESAVNGARANNHRRWKTFRKGKLILTREETGVLGRGAFELITSRIFQNESQILQISSSLGKRLCSFDPQTRYRALLIDADSDGVYERIVIRDRHDRMLDSFTMGRDGRITPNADADLQRQQESELRERTGP